MQIQGVVEELNRLLTSKMSKADLGLWGLGTISFSNTTKPLRQNHHTIMGRSYGNTAGRHVYNFNFICILYINILYIYIYTSIYIYTYYVNTCIHTYTMQQAKKNPVYNIQLWCDNSSWYYSRNVYAYYTRMVQALAMKKWPQFISTRCSGNILSSYVTIESNPPELSKSLLHNWTSATRIAFWRTATSTAKGQDGGASAEATIGVDNLMGQRCSDHLSTCSLLFQKKEIADEGKHISAG